MVDLTGLLLGGTCAACRQPCARPGDELCRSCRFAMASSPVIHLPHGIRAALRYDGAARSAVLALKFRNRRRVAQALAALMVARLGLCDGPRPHVVTWAPTSRARAGERGYDQAELLARALARRLGVPCRRLLYRAHGVGPQTGRGRADRLTGPQFRARGPRPGVRVLVVDDVVTTGATLHAAGRALTEAGIAHVVLVAATATPDTVRIGVGPPGAHERACPPASRAPR